jgi:hypothetical protein
MKILANKRLLWIIILVLLILNIASISTFKLKLQQFRTPEMRESRRSVAKDHFLNRQLNFSPEQQVQFDELLTKHREALDVKIIEISSLRKELIGMMRNQELSAESEEIVQRIGQKQSELELINYHHFKEVMAICDEEQKRIFMETMMRAVGPNRGMGNPNDRKGFGRNAKPGRGR